jgi:uncharacterized protein
VIDRTELFNRIQAALKRSRVVALIGPRQSGKSTLARQFLTPDSPAYFDLEDPVSLQRLDAPKTALAPLHDLVVIDEIQRKPELFPILRVLVDRTPLPAKFLILGSATRDLLRQLSESLAGRIEVIEISGFSLQEVGASTLNKHWVRGGFPLSFLAESEEDSAIWRKQFIQTFLERDIPSLGFRVTSATLFRFWRMLAHYHGQIWNSSEIAASMGVDHKRVRRYLDMLTGSFMVRQLQPWHENIGKRQVKSPKIYFRDSGIFHSLLGINAESDLLVNPKLGASWEGYAIEQVLRYYQPDEQYFWAVHSGAELDLFIFKNGKRIGIECKRLDAPKLTSSMKTALRDLKLDELIVLYPGEQSYVLGEGVKVVPVVEIARKIGNLGHR